jgi:flagellar basal-body rod protein FlgG
MMRALWTAASGMTSQQTNVDVIANNLANVNTVGYKKETPEFKTLLYQTIQTETTSANGDTKPVGAQVGLGVRNSAISTVFTQGPLTASDSNTDFAIDGKGFFAVQGADGQTYYTRNGSFNFAIGPNGTMLCNSDGLPVLDTNGNPIELGNEYNVANITVDEDGNICYPDATNNPAPIGIQIGVVQFSNPGGLEKTSGSLYRATAASGAAVQETADPTLSKSIIKQNYLESSNVAVVDEMVSLIVAQRAYEMNSKAIQAADDMMQQANNLRR